MKSPANPVEKLVLVVDDDEYICEFIKVLLEKEGFKTEAAFDGGSALEIVRSGKVDLLILDWMMPVLSGFEVLKALQEEGRQNIPVMIITARVTDENTVKMIKSEINVVDFETKPVVPNVLVARIHQILNTSSIKKQK